MSSVGGMSMGRGNEALQRTENAVVCGEVTQGPCSSTGEGPCASHVIMPNLGSASLQQDLDSHTMAPFSARLLELHRVQQNVDALLQRRLHHARLHRLSEQHALHLVR